MKYMVKISFNNEEVYKEFNTKNDAINYYERMIKQYPFNFKYKLYKIYEEELPYKVLRESEATRIYELNKALEDCDMICIEK